MSTPVPTPAAILVAEDQADIRDLLVLNLRNAGYEVDGGGRRRRGAGAARPRSRATCWCST